MCSQKVCLGLIVALVLSHTPVMWCEDPTGLWACDLSSPYISFLASCRVGLQIPRDPGQAYAPVNRKWHHRTPWVCVCGAGVGWGTWLFDNFVNFSPPFNILSGRLKAVCSLCHYLQQPVAYCNSSLQSWEDVFEFIIAAKSASNLPLERRSVRASSVCVHPQ